jgi:YVTN family beta-propeller protein
MWALALLRTTATLALIFSLSSERAVAQSTPTHVAGPRPDGTALSPQGWALTPAGRQVQLGDRPLGIALSPDGRTILVSNNGQSTQSLMVVDRASGAVRQSIDYRAPEALFLGLAFSPDGSLAFASAGGNNKVRVYQVTDQHLTEDAPIPLPTTVGPDGRRTNPYPAGLAIAPDGSALYVAGNLSNALWIIDLSTRAVRASVPVGVHPYAVVLSDGGAEAYVSNWGERSVSVVDTARAQVRQTVGVGTHPSALALHSVRGELYVANTDSDTISVIDTSLKEVARTLDLAPYVGAQEGSSPNALAVAGDTLYVANAGNNDVAVVRLGSTDVIAGLIPTAWYPTAVAVASDGSELLIANAKGLGAGPNPGGPNPLRRDAVQATQFVASMAVGSLSIVRVPNQDELDRYTAQVVANNGFDERGQVRMTTAATGQQVIPRRPGDPSPIKHVIYIIKENRTYDQLLGSLGKGNGDPSLNLFDDSSAPNTRELARRFVTLDNFYADAEVSADGWNWSTAASANTYVQKNWPASYSARNRPYDFEAINPAAAPGATPDDAYIWDRLDAAGISYRSYGVWIVGEGQTAPLVTRLYQHTNPRYPGYDPYITDQVRINEWLLEFNQFVATGTLPTVQLVRLPNDHTFGTRPGVPTPRAYVADNDLALGRLVEAVSNSPYWAETAIFVVEDDAQNGPDHVDAHRTVALAISPYTQTGRIDSTFYSTSSMLRTIELIVGLPPMSQFDAAATPMLASFTDTPDPRPYTAIVPAQPLDELNAHDAPMAAESLEMDFTAEDRTPELALNVAIWQSVRGADSEMPRPRTSFRSAVGETDDDDGDHS